jgi:hypothetical protein
VELTIDREGSLACSRGCTRKWLAVSASTASSMPQMAYEIAL